MERILVAAAEDNGKKLTLLLNEAGYGDITVVSTGAQARRLLQQGGYVLLLVDTPLADEPGAELALDAVQGMCTNAVMLVNSEYYGQYADKLTGMGVAVLPKPLNKSAFIGALRIVQAMSEKSDRLMRECVKLRKKVDEANAVGRAKCYIIEQFSLTENQAHRFIETAAMNTRSSRGEAALEVLRGTYNSTLKDMAK